MQNDDQSLLHFVIPENAFIHEYPFDNDDVVRRLNKVVPPMIEVGDAGEVPVN